MPAKKFASEMLAGTIWAQIMEGRFGYDTTVTIHVTNHNSTPIDVSLALTAAVSASIPNQDIFYLNQKVYPEDSRQFPGVVIEEGIKLAARSNSAGVSVLVYGFEEEQ
jgi:hypothetical protein